MPESCCGNPQDRPEWHREQVRVQYSQAELASLRELLEEVPDARKARGLRHPLGAVLALLVLAKLAGRHGGRAAEKFCQELPQRDLRVLRCRFNPWRGRYEAPSDTTFQRLLAEVEAGTLERVIQRWTQPRCGRKPRALAGDGKRIRGANRLAGEGLHWETVTLVDHATGLPVASHSYGEEGGEQWAMRALFEETDLRGVPVTLDTGHASYATETALVEQHGARYLLGIKGNTPATLATLQGLDWRGAQRTSHRWRKAHGRWEWRKLEALEVAAGQLRFRHARQALRVTDRTKTSRHGAVTEEVLDAITSLAPAQAGARRLLTLHRGHWRVENSNHYSRDTTFREDASRMRTGNAQRAASGAGDRGAAAGTGRDRARDADTADGAARESAAGNPAGDLKRGAEASGTAQRSARQTGGGGSEGAAQEVLRPQGVPTGARSPLRPPLTDQPRTGRTMPCPDHA